MPTDALPANHSPLSSVAALMKGGKAEESGSEVERVKEGVLQMIRERQILPGQRLDQRRLAKILDSTTAPLREALSSLEAERILVRERGMGVFCRSYTVKEIEELIEIRGVLEGMAARWAVPRMTPEILAELMALAQELEKPIEPGSEADFVRKHVQFHRRILELSGSSVLHSLMERQHFIDTILSNVAPSFWRVEPHDHHTIVEALGSGDPQKAETVMRNHIAPTFKERLEGLRKLYGEGFILPTH